MIKGIGTDIIAVSRIKKVLNRHPERFLERHFTLKEQKYCEGYRFRERHYAGRFACKEAIAKAFGKGIVEELFWTDIEILNNDDGEPFVELSKKAKNYFGSFEIKVSISHCEEYATAVAIVYCS